MTRIYAYFALLFCLSKALFEDNPQVQQSSIQQIQSAVVDPDFTVFSIIYDSSGNKSWQLARVLLDLTSKFSNYAKFMAYDCSADPKNCKQEMLPQLPSLEAFIPQGYNVTTGKPIVRESVYEGAISGKALGQFLQDSINYLGEIVESEADSFWESNLNKTILFTNKDSVPILFRAISSRLRDRLSLGVVWSKNTELTKKYNVEDYPTLIVFQGSETIKYNGKYEFKDIFNFLKAFASQEKLIKRITANEQPKENTQRDDTKVNKENFEEKVKDSETVVLAHFYKEKALGKWQELTAKYGGIVKYADISCLSPEEAEFCASQGVKKFPSLRIYPVNKSRKSYDFSFSSYSNFEEALVKELRPEIQIVQQSALQSLINSVEQENKLVALYISDKPVSLAFKALASQSRLKDFVKFFSVTIPESEASRYFNLDQYPTVVSFYKLNTMERASALEYRNDLSDFNALYTFILKDSLTPFLASQPEIDEEDQENIDQVLSSSNFNHKCLNKASVCVVGLLEKGPNSIENYKTLKFAKAVMEKRKILLNFIWVDGECQKEIREKLRVDEEELPSLAIYSHSKKKAAKIAGNFNKKNVFALIEDFLLGNADSFAADNLKFIDNCDSLPDKEVSTRKKKKSNEGPSDL